MNTYHQKLKVKLLPFLVAVAFFMQMLDSSILNTSIPVIAHQFGELPVRLDVAVTSFIFAIVILQPISGWISDRFSIKRIFFASVLMFTIGSLLCALSSNLNELTISRIIQGFGGALLMPVGRLAVLKSIPRKRYLSVISFIVLPALIGPLLGPTLGGFICQYLSWHWIFLINIPIGIACCIATLYLMPHIRQAKRAKFDLLGFLLFDMAAICFFLSGSDHRILGFANFDYFIFAVFFIALYIFYARKKQDALFNLDMFKTRNYSIGVAANLILRLAAGALPFLAPLFLQQALGFSPSKAGSMLIPLACGAMFAKTIVAKILKRLGYRKFLIINTTMMALFIFLLAQVSRDTPVWVILVIFGLIGTANSMQFTSVNTLAMMDVPNQFLSSANSLVSVAMQVSLALGVSFSALLIEWLSVKMPQAGMVAQFHVVYIIVACFTVINSATFLLIKKGADKPLE
jgi:EmrB/QacA subfamily drug resistance transporter